VLEILNLALEELDVVDGPVGHGGGVHLGAPRDEALQDADVLVDHLPRAATLCRARGARVHGLCSVSTLGQLGGLVRPVDKSIGSLC
jgi:hypothetical protein